MRGAVLEQTVAGCAGYVVPGRAGRQNNAWRARRSGQLRPRRARPVSRRIGGACRAAARAPGAGVT
jgi:hypothetical protein